MTVGWDGRFWLLIRNWCCGILTADRSSITCLPRHLGASPTRDWPLTWRPFDKSYGVERTKRSEILHRVRRCPLTRRTNWYGFVQPTCCRTNWQSQCAGTQCATFVTPDVFLWRSVRSELDFSPVQIQGCETFCIATHGHEILVPFIRCMWHVSARGPLSQLVRKTCHVRLQQLASSKLCFQNNYVVSIEQTFGDFVKLWDITFKLNYCTFGVICGNITCAKKTITVQQVNRLFSCWRFVCLFIWFVCWFVRLLGRLLTQNYVSIDSWRGYVGNLAPSHPKDSLGLIWLCA